MGTQIDTMAILIGQLPQLSRSEAARLAAALRLKSVDIQKSLEEMDGIASKLRCDDLSIPELVSLAYQINIHTGLMGG